MQMREEGRKVVAPDASKSRLAKASGAETAVPDPEMKKCTPLRRRSKFPGSKCTKRLSVGASFWPDEMIEKVHAVVARSTFPSQNVQSTLSVGPLLEVEMSKKVHAVVARSTFRSQNV